MKPLSIPPSLSWDGDDGNWSTFHIQVGNPPQTLRVLPGTSANAGSTLWVVIESGCASVNPNLPTCEGDRGGLFFSNRSGTWATEGLQTSPEGHAIYSLSSLMEKPLGRQGNASYGYDTITLGANGAGLPKLENQLLAGVWTNDFFLGSLGLSPHSFNFTAFNDPQPSVLSVLHNRSLISSLSWAYTAGARYHDPPVFGSLTLGGYDATRFQQNNMTFPFGADFSRDLLIGLKSITYDTEGAFPLLTSSQQIDVFVNSMVPEIWLPPEVCQRFQDTFNLTWHEQGKLYLVTDDAHRALVASNPSFTFTLGQTGAIDNGTVDIVLPYAAFDLTLTAPIVGNDTRWFPLKRAQNKSQYTLGRAFLQEAHVIVDYELRNFSVSQALFPPTSVQQDLVAISHRTDADKVASISAGTIAGIAVGVAVLLMLVVGAYWIIRRRRTQIAVMPPGCVYREDKPKVQIRSEELSSGTEVYEAGGRQVQPELSSSEHFSSRHELATKEEVAEVGDAIPPVELEAPGR